SLSSLSSRIFYISALFFFLHHSPHHQHLHSFPTRRSSDLQLRTISCPRLARTVIDQPPDQNFVHGTVPLRRADYFLDDHPVAIEDRKSTRLNSSHRTISYAVFCLKKKKKKKKTILPITRSI